MKKGILILMMLSIYIGASAQRKVEMVETPVQNVSDNANLGGRINKLDTPSFA